MVKILNFSHKHYIVSVHVGLIVKSFSAFLFRYLPREVDPLVYNMSTEDPGSVSYSEIGGLSEQIRELREVSEEWSNLNLLLAILN